VSDVFRRGQSGENLVKALLESRGHSVERAPRPFDLLVDGSPVEVKSTKKPWARFEFLGLTQKQFDALTGTPYDIYIVCDIESDRPDIRRIRSVDLDPEEAVRECRYYWYPKHLSAAKSVTRL